MKRQGPFAAGLALLAGLFFCQPASAQLPWRWLSPKSTDKAGKATPADARRVVEITVEVAWLADPVTFPYYLEAHVNTAQQLDVRGYVPNKIVREHALRIAQVYSSLQVVDSMKEHPSLLVRPSQMSPQQLQNSVLSSLRVALPKQYQQLRVECAADGKVYVSGQLNSFDEKVAVSHSLRRLHGCTSVQNMTIVPENAYPPPDKAIAGRTEPKSPWNPKKPTTVVSNKDPNPGTILIPPITGKDKGPDLGAGGTTDVIKVAQATKTRVSPADLQKSIRAACPNVTEADITFTSATDVSILVYTRNAAEVEAIAARILMLPELQDLRPDLQLRLASQK